MLQGWWGCDYAQHTQAITGEVVTYLQGSLGCQIWGHQVRNQLRAVSFSSF